MTDYNIFNSVYFLQNMPYVDISPLSPHDALKHHFISLKNRLNFPTTKGFRMKISRTLQFFFHLPPTSTHFHPLQVENCDSNSRLVVDEDDNGEFRLERVNATWGLEG